MSVMPTTHTYDPLGDADSDAEGPAGRPFRAPNAMLVRLPAAPTMPAPRRYPPIGAVLLDLMAELAGSSWAPEHERAWSEALANVTGLRGSPSDAGRRAASRRRRESGAGRDRPERRCSPALETPVEATVPTATGGRVPDAPARRHPKPASRPGPIPAKPISPCDSGRRNTTFK
jgi:hypothetical protein